MHSIKKTDKYPLVSVIIPTYNHAHFIGNAIESVINQTIDNWEIIIINNYSQDNTIEVVDAFNDSRIKLHNYHNKGVIAKSRNVGLKKSKGRYIAFLDSDDLWMPQKLEKQLAIFSKYSDLLLVSTNVKLIPKGKSKEIKIMRNTRLSFRRLLKGNVIANSSVMIKREVVDAIGFLDENPALRASEDYDYWLRLLRYRDNSAYFLNESLIKYRLHEASIIKNEDYYEPSMRHNKVKLIFKKHLDVGEKYISRMLLREIAKWDRNILKLRYYSNEIKLKQIILSKDYGLLLKLEVIIKKMIRRLLSIE